MASCCNFNCRQGRDCPHRPRRSLVDVFVYIGGYLDVFSEWFDHRAAVRNGELAVTTARNRRARRAAIKGRQSSIF